jgi:hypothetical protein
VGIDAALSLARRTACFELRALDVESTVKAVAATVDALEIAPHAEA